MSRLLETEHENHFNNRLWTTIQTQLIRHEVVGYSEHLLEERIIVLSHEEKLLGWGSREQELEKMRDSLTEIITIEIMGEVSVAGNRI